MDPPRGLNESLQELLCRHGTGNGTGTGNGSACDLLRRGFRGPPVPRDLALLLRVLLYAVIFVLSVGGNALVVAVLALNRRLRTVTNAFLLSLALSDLLLALCCMPFTLLPPIMGTFIFGEAVCKLVAYLMGLSVSVSTFSLVAIAIERHSAICHPLRSRSWQTRSHATRVIAGTWVLSALLMLPYALYSTTHSTHTTHGTHGPTHCTHRWPSQGVRQAWSVLLLLLLFFLPGVVMAVSYGLISRELCRGGRLQMGEGVPPPEPPPQAPRPPPEGDVRYLQLPGAELELQNRGGEVSQAAPQPPPHRVIASQAQLLAKRRVIRMLVAIVAIFFLCWLPLFVANTWRAFSPRAAGRALSGTPMAFIHLLSYSSACANPLLYGLMNRRFRDAILGSCHPPRTGRHRTPPAPRCCCCPRPPGGQLGGGRRRQGGGEEGTTATPSISKGSYTIASSLGPP